MIRRARLKPEYAAWYPRVRAGEWHHAWWLTEVVRRQVRREAAFPGGSPGVERPPLRFRVGERFPYLGQERRTPPPMGGEGGGLGVPSAWPTLRASGFVREQAYFLPSERNGRQGERNPPRAAISLPSEPDRIPSAHLRPRAAVSAAIACPRAADRAGERLRGPARTPRSVFHTERGPLSLEVIDLSPEASDPRHRATDSGRAGACVSLRTVGLSPRA